MQWYISVATKKTRRHNIGLQCVTVLYPRKKKCTPLRKYSSCRPRSPKATVPGRLCKR